MLDPVELISDYYPQDSITHDVLVKHGVAVAELALAIAKKVPHLKPDIAFIAQAAYLHDIGIGQTDAPSLGCHGPYHYVAHGVLGRNLMEKQGLNRIGLICERHVGVGVSLAEIERRKLPLPKRDMLPVTIEEQIVCYADKFFSKTGPKAHQPKPLDRIIFDLARFGSETVNRFEVLHKRFGI